MRMESILAHKGVSDHSTISCCLRASMTGRAASSAESAARRRSVTTLRNSSLPRVMRDTSSKSSSSTAILPTWRSITSMLQRCCSGFAPGERAIIAACRIGASGLRNSCASVARNSSLRRSASRSVCSWNFRSVTSVIHTAKPPSQGDAMTWNQPSDARLERNSNSTVASFSSAITYWDSTPGSSQAPGSTSRTAWPTSSGTSWPSRCAAALLRYSQNRSTTVPAASRTGLNRQNATAELSSATSTCRDKAMAFRRSASCSMRTDAIREQRSPSWSSRAVRSLACGK